MSFVCEMSNVGYFGVDSVELSMTQRINIILISFVEVDEG